MSQPLSIHTIEFNFLGLTLDSSLSFKFHLIKIGNKISRIIGLLHKLKHIFPSYLLRTIYNSLILSHMNYSLLAWGANCHSIELLQKKAVRVINFKSPLAHTEPILKPWISWNFLICIPVIWSNYIISYTKTNGESQHDLREYSCATFWCRLRPFRECSMPWAPYERALSSPGELPLG